MRLPQHSEKYELRSVKTRTKVEIACLRQPGLIESMSPHLFVARCAEGMEFCEAGREELFVKRACGVLGGFVSNGPCRKRVGPVLGIGPALL